MPARIQGRALARGCGPCILHSGRGPYRIHLRPVVFASFAPCASLPHVPSPPAGAFMQFDPDGMRWLWGRGSRAASYARARSGGLHRAQRSAFRPHFRPVGRVRRRRRPSRPPPSPPSARPLRPAAPSWTTRCCTHSRRPHAAQADRSGRGRGVAVGGGLCVRAGGRGRRRRRAQGGGGRMVGQRGACTCNVGSPFHRRGNGKGEAVRGRGDRQAG